MKLVSPQELELARTAPTVVALLLRQAGWKYFGSGAVVADFGLALPAHDTWYPPHRGFDATRRKLVHSLEEAWKLHLNYYKQP